MRHPTFRILIALLMAACAPLCCCQASSWLGFVRGTAAAAAPTLAFSSAEDGSDGDKAPCCELCIKRSSQKRSQHENEQTPCESGCKVCPSCQGVAGGSGLDGHVKVPQFNAGEILPPPFLWAVLCCVIEPHGVLISGPARDGQPACARANRELLRWQCALIV